MTQGSQLDTLFIEDLCLYAKIGVTDAERAHPQRLLLLVELGFDASIAGMSGRLEDTICYASLAEVYREVVESRSWVLVEELLEALSYQTFEAFDLARQIRLKLKKFVVPQTQAVGIEILRVRKPPTVAVGAP